MCLGWLAGARVSARLLLTEAIAIHLSEGTRSGRRVKEFPPAGQREPFRLESFVRVVAIGPWTSVGV